MTGTLTAADVPAVLKVLLAKATIPGPQLREPTDEPRTWYLLGVHPDDEPAIAELVAADPWLQATVTVQASQLVDPGNAYLINQDKLKLDFPAEYQFAEPTPMPFWLRSSLLYPPSPIMPRFVVTP